MARLLLPLAALALAAAPAQAQSILRDAETEAFLRDMNAPLAKAAGLDPDSVQVLLIGDPSINAFVTGGQNVFFHSGLLVAATDVNQVQGVHAHELGHIAAGHGVRFGEGAGPASNISILSLVLGAALLAAGAGDAGMAAIMGGQQAALGSFLSFNRDQESRADQAGARYLDTAGVSGRGFLSFFGVLGGQERALGIPQDNAYARTHPLSAERISALTDVLMRSAAWNKPVDPVLNARFLRIRGKLIGFVYDPAVTFQAFPPSDTSDAARYARAYAFHKQAFPDKAVAEVDAMLARTPNDPYVLELKGQVLLESGRVADAIPPLRAAVAASNGQPLIAGMLGHALVQTDDRANDAEAERVLRAAVARDNRNPFAWLQLGIVYDRRGDAPRAALATAERLNLSGEDPRIAATAARRAMAGLPEQSRDWIRAQDIALVSEDAAEKLKKRRR